MELNLERLNGLALSGKAEEAQEKRPSRTPVEPQIGQWEYKDLATAGGSTEGQIEGVGALQREADMNREAIERSIEVCRLYQENIRKSERLQTEILKGVRAGGDIYSLFLKAVEAISCMVSDPVFKTQIEEDLKAIYGRGLQDQTPLKMELEETQKRLEKLREAQRRETDPASLKRIGQAVKEHEDSIVELAKLIDMTENSPA